MKHWFSTREGKEALHEAADEVASLMPVEQAEAVKNTRDVSGGSENDRRQDARHGRNTRGRRSRS